MSVGVSVRPHGPTRLSLDGFSWNLIFENFRKSVEKIQVPLKSNNNNRYFTWRPIYIVYHISLSSSYNEKYFRQKLQRKSKHSLCSVTFIRKLRLFEIMWKNTVGRGRPQMKTIWRMRIACWIPKATNTNSEYVILIAFPLPQWLQERATMLRRTYTDCVAKILHDILLKSTAYRLNYVYSNKFRW